MATARLRRFLRTPKGAVAVVFSALLALAGTAAGWTSVLPHVLAGVAGGAFVVDRINKFPLVLSFAAAYIGLFTVAALVNPVAVAEMYRTPFVQSALFLALFMLTDPPTSPSRFNDQLWIGALAGVASVVAQLVGVGQAYLLVGVLVGNVALAVRRTLAELRAGQPVTRCVS